MANLQIQTIQEIKKDQSLINLEKSFGSTKGKVKKLFNSKIKNKIAEKLIKNLDKQIGSIPNTGNSVQEIRKIRKQLSKGDINLDEINKL